MMSVAAPCAARDTAATLPGTTHRLRSSRHFDETTLRLPMRPLVADWFYAFFFPRREAGTRR